MGYPEPPDYSSKEYLPKLWVLIDYIDSYIKEKQVDDYQTLLDQLSKFEEKLPSGSADRSAVRMIAGRRMRLQQGLIEKLENAAA